MNKIMLCALVCLLIITPKTSFATDAHHGHHAKAAIEGLKLNQGQKWSMDMHTRKMSTQMRTTFMAANHSNLKSLKTLGSSLSNQMDKLIAGCTMKGKAHDQLHVFLSNHIPTITAMRDAGEYALARKQALKLKAQFEQYQKYFK